MRDILTELGVNHCSHELEDTWLEFYATNYVQCRKSFSEALSHVQELFDVKEDEVLAKTYTISSYDYTNPEFMLKFWRDVNQFIKENTSKDWSFSYITVEDTEKFLDQYDDFGEDCKEISVYAYVKSFDQFTSQEQKDAINTMRYYEMKLKEAKENLDRYKRMAY